MPARVDSRLGSIFEETCDLLVIPSSVDGTLMPEMQRAVREAGLPFPSAMTRGEVTVLPSANPKYHAVAYAATVAGQTSSNLVVYGIGRTLGGIAAERDAQKISAPVLGAGSGDLPAAVAAAALARGFQETAPESSELWISVWDPEKFKLVTAHLLGLVPAEPEVGLGDTAATRGPELAKQMLARALDPTLPEINWRHVAERIVVEHIHRSRGDAAPPLSPAAAPPARKSVFISYSHADAEWLDRLQKHLKPLQREGVDVWSDTRLRPGEPWREEIRHALAKTKVAILLISADFISSDFINTDELPPLLKAAEDDGAAILPVIVSPSRFERMESLSRFQAVNDPAKPLVQMRRANREKALDDVARAVEDALNR